VNLTSTGLFLQVNGTVMNFWSRCLIKTGEHIRVTCSLTELETLAVTNIEEADLDLNHQKFKVHTNVMPKIF